MLYMNTTPTTTRAKMVALNASQTTATLATTLLAIGEMPTSPELRIAGCAIIDELVRRFPEIATALDAWEFDLSGEVTMIEATVAAIPMEALAA